MTRAKAKADRNPQDFYETPGPVVRSILENVRLPMSGLIIDAGCGSGIIARELARVVEPRRIVAVELDPEIAKRAEERLAPFGIRVISTDFLTLEFGDTVSAVVMNPPFSHAQRFVNKALALTEHKGDVLSLKRLGWLASAERRDWFCSEVGIPDPYVLHHRPTFIGAKYKKKRTVDGNVTVEERTVNMCEVCHGTAIVETVTVQTCVVCRGKGFDAVATDSADYAWMRWQRFGERPNGVSPFGCLRII